MTHPGYPNGSTPPPGTASGPYALTPAMLTAMVDCGDLAVRAVALSWALAGYSRGGSSEVGAHLGKESVEQARRYESYLKSGGR